MPSDVLDTPDSAYELVTTAKGPAGALPLTDDLLRHAPVMRRIGDVALYADRAGANLAHRLVQRLPASGGDDDLRAFGSEELRRRQSDAAVSPGDDRDFVTQYFHVCAFRMLPSSLDGEDGDID